MKIKLKDAMKIAEKITEERRKLDDAFRRVEADRQYMEGKMYELEKRMARLEMKLAEMNGEVNKPGCDKACDCEPREAIF